MAATIHLALLGPAGLREVAELSVDKAHRLAEKLGAVPGFRLRFAGPFFDEFALECPGPAERVRNALLKDGLLAGVPQQHAEACVAALRAAGYADATAIGSVRAMSGPAPVLRVDSGANSRGVRASTVGPHA